MIVRILDRATNQCKTERSERRCLVDVRPQPGRRRVLFEPDLGRGFDDYGAWLPWREGMTDVDINWDLTRFEGSQGTSDKP